MSNRNIHHRCRCLGQTFTFEEWCAYLKAHPDSSNEVVLTYGSFGFNIHDVCMNPNIPVKWSKGRYHLEVHTAQSSNGRWSHESWCSFYYSEFIDPVIFVSTPGDGFTTEKEAVYNALTYIEQRCVREITESEDRIEYDDYGNVVKNVSALPLLKQTLSQIRRYKEVFDPEDLSLF